MPNVSLTNNPWSLHLTPNKVMWIYNKRTVRFALEPKYLFEYLFSLGLTAISHYYDTFDFQLFPHSIITTYILTSQSTTVHISAHYIQHETIQVR